MSFKDYFNKNRPGWYSQLVKSFGSGSTKGILKAGDEYAELHAKEFSEFIGDQVSTVGEIEDYNKNDKILLTRKSNKFYYNHKINKWASDRDELYKQFKEKK